MADSRASRRISTVTNITIGTSGSSLELWRVLVTTATATAVITLRQGSSTGTVIATINGATLGSYDFGGLRCPDGLYVDQTVAAADVCVVYS